MNNSMKYALTLLSIFIVCVNVRAQEVVDPTTLNNKIMAGYQGWFGAPGDGNDYGWIHWSGGTTPAYDNITFDMWPDLREYDEDELFLTNFEYEDGTNAGLFSSYTKKTVDRHVQWMKDYGIDGVFVQRFISSAKSRRDERDSVLQNVRYGAEAHGRVFANMYDMSGGNPSTWVQDVINDWKHLVDDIKITDSPNYLHHNGKPVLSLWGVHAGNSKDILTAAQWGELLKWFTEDAPDKYRVTLKAGVNNTWKDDSQAWQDVYDKFEFISPWAVGRYGDNNGADAYRDRYFQADLDETATRGMEYIPVVFPGFSWYNLKIKSGEDVALNAIPRNRGEFLWHQMYNAIDAGCNMIYVAMFDEVDEGTAIFKIAENDSQTPTTGKFVSLDADGLDLPSDWYLKLTGEASKMLRGEIALTSTIPISPYPNTAKFISQEIATQIDPGATVSISITMKNTGTTTWTKSAGYRLASVDPQDNLNWGINRIDLEEGDAIAPGQSKTFTFDISAPSDPNIYRIQWKMIKEGTGLFGEKTKHILVNVGSPSFFLDDCDATSGWDGTGAGLNTTDQIQGAACLEFNGSGTNEFQKVFSTPYNSGIAAHEAVLQFWYYTSDASKMGSSGQVELGSKGTYDEDEYNWSLKNLETGWNLITLKISDASKMGNPDLNAINWFRLYNIKSGSVTTRIDEIQLLDFNASVPKYELQVNDGTGAGSYIESSLVEINADPARDGFVFNEWTINSGNADIIDKNASSTLLQIFTEDVEISATYKLMGFYLDDCDALSGWSSSSAISLNNTDNKEGESCIEFYGNGADEFKKAFNSPYRSGVPASRAVLQFWYYISDPSVMSENNQLEIGSAGVPDSKEYMWNLTGMSAGWNLVNLKVSEANTTNGAADLNAINWFRYYNFKSGPVTTRIDAIEIIDPNGGEKYILIVNDGQGTGAFYAGSEIPISAEPAPEGQQFDKWVINEGTPSIADLNAASTTLTMTTQDADITAAYKEAEVSVPQSLANEQYMTIYPNPLAGGELSVKLVGIENSANVNVLVTNLLGQTVYHTSTEYSDHIVIDASALPKSSVYVLTVETGQSLFIKKLIVE